MNKKKVNKQDIEYSDFSYYYLSSDNNVAMTNHVPYIDSLMKVGNLYETESEAQLASAKRLSMESIKVVCSESWRENDLSEWNGKTYTIGVDMVTGEVIAVEVCDNISQMGELRFPNKESIAFIVNGLGEDMIKELCW
jgi:hypothetical protein